MALRVLPALADAMVGREGRRANSSTTVALPVLRGLAVAWLAGIYPNEGARLQRAAAFASRDCFYAASHAKFAASAAAAADAAGGAADAAAASSSTAASFGTSLAAAANAAVSFTAGVDVAASAAASRASSCAAVTADAAAIERGVAPRVLGFRPLWPEGQIPPWAADGWSRLKSALVDEGKHWEVWTDWYQDRLDGKEREFEEVELARGMLGEEFWEGGPEKVNRELMRILAEERAKETDRDQQEPPASSSTTAPPEIPQLQPAAVEPLWVEQQLILPRRALPSDIDPQTLQAALRSLRRSLSVLAEDAENDTNVDRRAVRMLRLLAEAIPDDVPPQDVLFDLGHGLARLRDYQGSVHEQWPDILAAGYNAAVLQYDRTVRQFPRWREFIRNADRDRLTAEQVRSVRVTAETFGAVLDSEGVDVVVDPGIRQALARLTSLLPSAADIEQANEIVDAAIQEVALDLLESLDNVLKRLAERTVDGYPAIAALNFTLVPLLKRIWDSPTVLEARNNFESAFKAQLSKAAKAAGKEAAEAVFYVPVCLLMFGVASALGVTGIGAAALTLAPVASRFKWCRDLMSWMKKSLGG